MTRCDWRSADLGPTLRCAAPAIEGALCVEHLADAVREVLIESQYEAQCEAIRWIATDRAIWRTLGMDASTVCRRYWAPLVLAHFCGATSRRLAKAVVEGREAQLTGDDQRELVRILAGPRGPSAGVAIADLRAVNRALSRPAAAVQRRAA